MTLEEIVSEIEESRKRTIASLHDEFVSRGSHLEAKFQEELKAIEAEFRKKSSRELKNFENREIDLSNLESSRILQDRRYELLKDGLERIGAAFNEFPKETSYEDFLSKGITIAGKKLGKLGEIRCRKPDIPVFKKLAGDGTKLSDLDASGGFIASSSSGKTEIDLLLETLFKNAKEEIEEILSSKIGEK